MKKIMSLLAMLFSIALIAQVNAGIIKGTITDSVSGDPIAFANVSLLNGTDHILGTTSDFDGKYILKSVESGNYSIQISFVGFQTKRVNEIEVVANKIAFVDVKLNLGHSLKSVEIIAYKPIIKRDASSANSTITSRELRKSPVREAIRVGNGIMSRDNGSKRNYARGQRSSRSVTYIDGIKMGEYDRSSYSYDNDGELYQEISDNEFKKARSTPLSTFSIDVDKASYANARRYINDGQLPPASAVRIEEMINYFKYEYPQPEDEHPFSITTEFSDCPWNPERKLGLIGIQGKDLNLEEAPKNNLVFLIDVSGSMNSQDKLGLLKSGLHLLIDQLRSEDRISIVVYAGAAGLVLPSTNGTKKDKIREVINQLSAGGSTAGGEGIQLAYETARKNFKKGGNNRVILATDGDFNVGISDQQGLVKLIEKERESGVFLSVLGFGSGNLQDFKMEQLADKGNGNYNYIDNILEAKKVLVNEMSGTLFTIAKDVKVQAEFNPKKVKAYRLIGYVNRKLKDEDFNNDKKDAGELGAGHSVTVLYEIIPKDSKEKLIDIDPLKYQSNNTSISEDFGDEVLTIKFRYKRPNEKQSILMETTMKDVKTPFENTSSNFKFSASVASFGMILRKSESIGKLKYNDVLSMARKSKGADKEGYRAEFIRLVETAELLKK